MRFTPTDIVSQYAALSALNANFDTVATLIELCLFRDGTSPNQMLAALNMNSYKINNLANGTANADAVNKGQMDTAIAASYGAATTAAATANAAAAAADIAAAAANAAAATIVGGTFTPTLNNFSPGNHTNRVLEKAYYRRDGNIVTVAVSGSLDVTTGGTFAQMQMTLPVATTTLAVVGSGVAIGNATAFPVGCGQNSGQASMIFYPTGTGTHTFDIMYQYEVN